MMSVIHSYYQAFNEGNREKMLRFLADDVVHEVNQGKAQVGLETFKKFMVHMDDCYSEQLKDIVIFYDASTKRGAAEFVVDGKYLKTDGSLPPAHGQTYLLKAGAFLELNENNKIKRITTYYNLPAWIDMVK